VAEGLGEAWILRTSNTGTASTIPIERLRVRPGAPQPVVENAGHWTLAPADIHPEATGFSYEPAGAVYDPVDDALVWISALALAARAETVRRAVPKQEEKLARTDPRLLQEDVLGAAFNDKAQEARLRHDDGEGEGEGRQLRESWDKAQKQDKRPHRTDPRLLEEDALREEFDEAAQARRPDNSEDSEGENGRSRRKSWKQRAQEKGHRRGRGRGYGMKRDGD